MPMTIAEHLAALRAEGDLLAVAAERGDLDAPVPSCPGWALRDVLRHTGGVHRWAHHYVTTGDPDESSEQLDRELMETWGEDADLVDWFRAGHTALVAALTDAPDSLSCWTFLPAPSPRAFWSRRQAHETAIHRVDAESATGAVSEIAPAFGADGVDELLLGFYGRRRPRRWGAPARLALTATDLDRRWLVDVSADAVRTDPDPSENDCAATDCAVTATASELYRLVWNRRGVDGLAVTGSPDVLDRWRSATNVRWS